MKAEFRLGSAIYYVPSYSECLATYVPVTRIHSVLKRPHLTLGNQLVITPKLTRSGMLARDNGGSFWISKEAFDASVARVKLWKAIFIPALFSRMKTIRFPFRLRKMERPAAAAGF